MVRFHDELTVYASLSVHVECRVESLTSILDTVLSEDAVTPVAHATNGLHAACPVSWARVERWVIEYIELTSEVHPVEALPEVTAHSVPSFSVRMLYRSSAMRRLLV